LPLLPLFAVAHGRGRARAYVAAAAVVIAVAATTAVTVAPQFTEQHPQPLNVVYVEEAGGAAFWGVQGATSAREIPEPLRTRGAFGEASPEWSAFLGASALRGFAGRMPARATEPLGMPGARLEVVSEAGAGVRSIMATLHPSRDGNRVMVVLPAGAELLVDGRRVTPLRRGANQIVALHGVPQDGLVLEFRITGAAARDIVLIDQSPGLPAGGAALTAARPSYAAPIGDGDVTIVQTRFTL
jgi:hypothetical protein